MNQPDTSHSDRVVELRLAGLTIRISRFTFLAFLGLVVGVVTGVVAVLFRKAAIWGEGLFFPYHGLEEGLDYFSIPALKRIIMPMVGGLICGFVLYKVGNFKRGHSIPAILETLASGRGVFSRRFFFPPLMALVTLVCGGSAGPEGPIAEIGSVTGSQIGRFSRLPPKTAKTLIGSGVAAGIAAVFNAPIGGVFFAIEVILRNYEISSLTPILIAAVVASVISRTALGDEMAISFIGDFVIPMHELPFFILLGLICGFISMFYIYGIGACHSMFSRSRMPLWIKPAVGGLLVGLTGWFFPNIMGEGYDWIGRVIRGEGGAWEFLLVLLVLKVLATGLTLGSGQPGGAFAPAVFTGVMGGAVFGQILERLGFVDGHEAYALMGMAGLIAGALGAPVTAIMVTLQHVENSPSVLLPVMTTVALCAFIMQLRGSVTVYTLDFLRRGIDLDRTRRSDPLSLIQVKRVLHNTGFDELQGSMPVFEAFDRFRDSTARWFVVRGDHGEYAGIITLHEMRMAITERELSRLLVVSDITDSFQPRLNPDMSLKQALVSFNSTDAEVLPVFSEPDEIKSFMGYISRQDALNAYWRVTDED
jgi:CIC family chloride channel protein